MEIVNKGGEEWLRLSLIPDKRGLMIDVRVHPLVEEFMQSLGDGAKIPIGEVGGRGAAWLSADEGPIFIYPAKRMPMAGQYQTFCLDSPGSSLIYDENQINLSFLRIAGISQGVRFISSKDVFPLQFRRELKSKIGTAFRHFCMDYIKPVKITLIITSQEL